MGDLFVLGEAGGGVHSDESAVFNLHVKLRFLKTAETKTLETQKNI